MQKLRKLTRYWQARLQPPSALPFFWHVGRPNFGDDINPSFFGELLGHKVRLISEKSAPHFLGMGSILERATSTSIVLGSGFLSPPTPASIEAGKVVAVRGALSAAGLKYPSNALFGDPMVLLPDILPLRYDREGPVGVVPHITDVARARAMNMGNVKIIDPADDPWNVVKQIAGCSRILSQSLHGLIVADALHVPNVWLEPSASMKGGRFKFDDYFTTIDTPKQPMEFSATSVVSASASQFTVGAYIYDRQRLMEAFHQAVSTYSRSVRNHG